MTMLPEAKYKARAIEWSQVTAHEKTGNEEIRVLVEVTDGEHKGQQRTWRGYFTEGTAERTVESLRYFGWAGDDITDVQGLDANEVQIVIKHEQWEGKLQEKIAWINRLSSVYIGTPLDAAKKADFAKRMKGLVVASKSAIGSSPNPKPAGTGKAEDFNFGHNVSPGQQGGQTPNAGYPFPKTAAGAGKVDLG